jgi:acetyltransferase
VLQLESVTEARKFMSAARAFARRKPIVAYKPRSTVSPRAPVSHAGALADDEAVYDAALARAGVVRVGRIDEVFGAAELLARERLPRGARLAVVTNAGSPVARAAQALLARAALGAWVSNPI